MMTRKRSYLISYFDNSKDPLKSTTTIIMILSTKPHCRQFDSNLSHHQQQRDSAKEYLKAKNCNRVEKAYENN